MKIDQQIERQHRVEGGHATTVTPLISVAV
jgi:hypothetical protein